MQFLDKTKIVIKAGNGGDGCSAFHREKYINKGGPSGGDGGKGGNLVFVADPQLSTLLEFKYQRHYRAPNGENGKAELQTGRDGEDLFVHVPIGTIVRDVETGAILADMSEAGRKKVVLYGGRGGKGNARFATATRQSPEFAQNGQRNEDREVELELKTIADVGIIGLPSVGKSTILSVLTSAKPKIAAYHFTTLTPNLGVASRHGRTFVLADIPGLIEGAAEGAGLGHDFLRHIERTRILVHVLDISGSEGRDPLDDFYKINNELSKFSDTLASLPQIVLANKMDLPQSEDNLERLRAALEPQGCTIFPVSAATTQGFSAMLDCVVQMLDILPPVTIYEEAELDLGPQYERGFTIHRDDSGAYVVEGGDIDKLLDTTDPDSDVSMRRFQQHLIKGGVISALREMGCKEGDSIKLGDWEFDFVD
ncbi:MAG: GTPase ObgE [Eubacteriales bacterium]|nr:GTPase ObgE [Eubacteriales bacterium]